MWQKEGAWNRVAAAVAETIRSLILPSVIKFINLRSRIIIMAFRNKKKQKKFFIICQQTRSHVVAHQQIVNVSLDYGY